MIEIKNETEKVILVGVSLSDQDDTKESLEELKDLVSTAGAETVGMVIQNREQQHPGTYVGKGKIEELKSMIWELRATGIVCDDELSPAQMNNLSDALEIKVMDRTLLILDIFAARANTNEGKIQVELAQLRYRSSRLSGLGNALSSQRSRSNIPVVAIVGYTNAGKSTLLNTLTGAGILAENKLFATLDPTTRGLELESGQQILLTDTVGFISKLPHHLVEAFKSTLEEAVYADIILHVVDASNPAMDSQMYVVYDTLEKLGAGDKPIITAFNKIEIAGNKVLKDFKADKTVNISALHGDGLTELKDTIEEVLRESKIYIEKTYSYTEASKISLIRKYGQLISEEYVAEGIEVKAYVPTEIYDKVK